MDSYICIYQGKRTNIHAKTPFKALAKAIVTFNAKRSREVTVVLAETADDQILKTTSPLAMDFDYWKACLEASADQCGLTLNQEQLAFLAETVVTRIQ